MVLVRRIRPRSKRTEVRVCRHGLEAGAEGADGSGDADGADGLDGADDADDANEAGSRPEDMKRSIKACSNCPCLVQTWISASSEKPERNRGSRMQEWSEQWKIGWLRRSA